MPRKYSFKVKPSECADCGTPLVQPYKGRRLRCETCAKSRQRGQSADRYRHDPVYRERSRIRKRMRPPFAPTECERCGLAMDAGRFNQRRFCEGCVRIRKVESQSRWQERHPGEKPKRRTPIGSSRPVYYGQCPECEALFSTSVKHQRFCSRTHSNRYLSREYQRKTHKTAIRYWRIANTPEANQLAETMFNLRQEMRNHGVTLSPK